MSTSEPPTDALTLRLFGAVNALLRTFLVAEGEFPPAEGKARFNPLDFNLLRDLEAHPGTRATDVAARLRVSPTTLQSALDRLVRRGLVAKTVHPDSARARALTLTEAGQALRAAIHAQDMTNMRALLATLAPDERDTVVELLEKAVRGLGGGQGA